MKIFSLPVNPFIDESFLTNTLIPFLDLNHKFIFDVYCTARISPFDTDAMGANLDKDSVKEQILFYSDFYSQWNIPVTAVFNNISVNISNENLELFIKNFRELYDNGIKSIILPFEHWVLTGKLQKEFPELYIKNTIVNRISNPQDIYNSAKSGYDFIYVDRNIMRDLDIIKTYPILKEKIKKDFNKNIKLALLINENCIGRCNLQQEHYLFNNIDGNNGYFSSSISNKSCMKWKKEDPAYTLKSAFLYPTLSEINRMLKYFDIFKLHGRDDTETYNASLVLINNYRLNNEVLTPARELGMRYLLHNSQEKLEEYLKITQNCKFQCWNCSWCDKNVKQIKKD